MILIGLYTQEDGNSWWSSRRTWRSMDMRGTRCLRFRSDPERTCKWTVCLTLDFSPCDWSLLNIYLFGGGEFILLLNALLWDVRAQGLYIDGYQSHGVNCLCGMPKWQYDQGFCWKAKSCGWWSKHGLCGIALCSIDSRASHPGCEPEMGEGCREGMRFFQARVVSVTYQPWHLYTFHLCGCWNTRRLDYRSVRTGKRVFRNN